MMERTGIYAQNASLILSNSSGGGRTAGQGRNAGRGNNGGRGASTGGIECFKCGGPHYASSCPNAQR